MQINDGTISVDTATNAALVQGSSTVDWSQVQIGNLFIASNTVYQITSVNAVAKQITISPEWVGGDVSGQSYAIVRDYTLNHNLPLLNPGDLEASAIVSRMAMIIDSLLGTSESTNNEITITVGTPTTFLIGNILGLTGSTWHLCRTDDVNKRTPVAIVTWVAGDGLSFKVKTEGRITGIQGITLTPFSKYYIRATPTSGGGQLVNLTDNTAEVGDVIVPILIADSSSSGFLLNLAVAQTAIFSDTVDGLVPKPDGATGYLKHDGTWENLTVADDSLQSDHFDKTVGIVDWPALIAGDDNLSVYKHILDLNERLEAVEDVADVDVAYHRQVFTYLSNPTGLWSVTIPAGVTEAVVTIIGAGYAGKTITRNGQVFISSSHIDNSPTMPDGGDYRPIILRAKMAVTAGMNLNGHIAKYNSAGISSNRNVITNGTAYAGSSATPANLRLKISESEDPILYAHVSVTQYQVGRISPNNVLMLSYPLSNPTNSNLSDIGMRQTLVATGSPTFFAPHGAIIVEWGLNSSVGILS
jgi:hypothetical protein